MNSLSCDLGAQESWARLSPGAERNTATIRRTVPPQPRASPRATVFGGVRKSHLIATHASSKRWMRALRTSALDRLPVLHVHRLGRLALKVNELDLRDVC